MRAALEGVGYPARGPPLRRGRTRRARACCWPGWSARGATSTCWIARHNEFHDLICARSGGGAWPPRSSGSAPPSSPTSGWAWTAPGPTAGPPSTGFCRRDPRAATRRGRAGDARARPQHGARAGRRRARLRGQAASKQRRRSRSVTWPRSISSSSAPARRGARAPAARRRRARRPNRGKRAALPSGRAAAAAGRPPRRRRRPAAAARGPPRSRRDRPRSGRR